MTQFINSVEENMANQTCVLRMPRVERTDGNNSSEQTVALYILLYGEKVVLGFLYYDKSWKIR